MLEELMHRYRDAAGVEHHMHLECSDEDRWRVLDVSPAGTRLVEELTGPDDERPQAEALARDYAESRHHPRESNA